ncbi:MAG: sulfatase activating formylglycine-generating enzyme [Planctomycetota bacterium]
MQRAIREKHAPTPSTRLKREKGTAQTIAPSHGTDERSLVRQLTGDLDWICLKALEKEPSRRYASASELADDVRRHLANEPVLAGRPSAAYRASKFVLRNRVAVAAGVLVGFAAIAGIFGILLGQLVARAQRPNADGYRLLRLEERAGKLWPAHPEMIKPFVDWLEEAKDLMAGYEGYRAELAEIRERAPERSDEEIIEDRDNFAGADALNSKEETLEQLQQWLKPDDPDDLENKFPGTREAIRANIAKLEPEIAELKVGFGAQRTWTFPNVADQARHDVLTKLVKGLVRLRDPETGLLGEEGVSPEHGWSIPKRLALALRFRAGIAAGGEWDQSWIDAIEAIRSHQDFGGFELPRQVALVPIGTDSDSGLQAFWHPATGIEPTRDLASSRFVLTDKTGLVFVLIPGGTFMMGTPKTSPGAPNHESYLGGNEFPAHPESVGPFFISKFEMSQAQWETAWNANPSLIQYNMGLWREPTNPITLVSWDECDETLRRLGLVLPIEKQWEYAARAGTESTWWPGDDLSLLQDVANVGDETTFRYFWHRNYSNDDPNREFDASSALPMPNGASFKWTEVSGLDSGRLTVDSVHSNAANGWGLHNVHGNVSEFCLNQPYQYGTESGRDSSTALLRSVRGGNKQLPASFAKSASRSDQSREDRRPGVGIRPALAISR